MMRRRPLPDTYPALIGADAVWRFYASRRDSLRDAIRAFYTDVIRRHTTRARGIACRRGSRPSNAILQRCGMALQSNRTTAAALPAERHDVPPTCILLCHARITRHMASAPGTAEREEPGATPSAGSRAAQRADASRGDQIGTVLVTGSDCESRLAQPPRANAVVTAARSSWNEPSASEARSRRMSSSVQVTLWTVASR